MTNGKGIDPSTHSPAPSEPSSGALEAAQAAADATAQRFVDSSDLSYAERTGLVTELKAQLARIDKLTAGQTEPDWGQHAAHRVFGDDL